MPLDTMLTKPPVPYDNCVAVKAVVVAFNQEKALVAWTDYIWRHKMD